MGLSRPKISPINIMGGGHRNVWWRGKRNTCWGVEVVNPLDFLAVACVQELGSRLLGLLALI